MISFLLFCFAVIGMTNIIVDSNLFEPVRDVLKRLLPAYFYQLLECHQCCGTWCGFLCGWLLLSTQLPVIFLCGCAGSFLASSHYLLTELILSKTELHIPGDE